jgi:hypothetical protein
LRHERKLLAAWKSGKDPCTGPELVLKIARYRSTLGKPVAEETIGKAIREHGHRGLGALSVAAEWTLNGATPGGSTGRGTSRQPRSRPGRGPRRARSPGRKDDDSELVHRIAAALAARGPLPATTLARELRRRPETVGRVLRAGPFHRTGSRRASRWALAPSVHLFSIADAATRWGVALELAEEFLAGPEGFAEGGLVTAVNGGFAVTRRGATVSHALASVDFS